MIDHAFGLAAEENPPEPGPAVAAKHDQPFADLAGDLEDDFIRQSFIDQRSAFGLKGKTPG